LLTDEQQRRWKDMTGNLFKGEITFRPASGPFCPPASR